MAIFVVDAADMLPSVAQLACSVRMPLKSFALLLKPSLQSLAHAAKQAVLQKQL